jgi:hypothetical protein
VSIKPGAQAPGKRMTSFKPANAGDGIKVAQMPMILQAKDCRPFHGLPNSLLLGPGAYTPGFMLTPAPQAKKPMCKLVKASSTAGDHW